MAEEGSSGRRPGSARGLAGFLWQAEERPVASGAARAADTAIAVVATIAAVVAVIAQARTHSGSYGEFIARPGTKPVLVGQPWAAGWPSPWILLGAAMTTAPLAFRRTYPIATFCVIMVAVIGTSGYTTSITFASVIFAAYGAVAYSVFRRAALLSVLVAAIIVTAAYPDTSPPVPKRFGALLVLLPTVAVGIAIRVWRRRAGESAERLRLAQAEHQAETRRAVALERARIASEMHDVVTHNVSVMVVQAGAARRVLDSSPGDAREALLAVEASGRTAMTELRHLLGLLAPSGEAEPGPAEARVPGGAAPGGAALAPPPALAPQPGVARIPALLARVCAAGMPVELSVEAPAGSQRVLPPGIDLAAFRVVQEALTNVMKHAGQARTTVRLEYRQWGLLITVCDDGPPPGSAPAGPAPGPGSGGRGLIGLRERIAVYGGELDAGPRPGRGWRLTARIPLEPVTGDLPVPPEFQAAST
ncbi:MAG TPA: histidine kinase [Streptosporangiaceae bacterium]|nr:histidine kinase [Streptosporangiaceae bacterium]